MLGVFFSDSLINLVQETFYFWKKHNFVLIKGVTWCMCDRKKGGLLEYVAYTTVPTSIWHLPLRDIYASDTVTSPTVTVGCISVGSLNDVVLCSNNASDLF